MSRTEQAAMSRRTKRGQQPPLPSPSPAAAFCGTPKIVSNPIFCEDGSDRFTPVDRRCGYGPGSVHALVHDVVPAAAAGVGNPLPLPPSRTRLHGSRGAGPTALVMNQHGCWVLRRVPQDPFLAAYVACTKSGGTNAAPVKQQQQHKKKRGETARGCGIWNGWAAGAKYAGAMSCRYGCAVNVQGDASAAAPQAQASPGPRLHLSRPLAVLPARERALVRRRAQS